MNLVVMTLIVAGGLGFPVWLELYEHRFRDLRHLSVHTKVMVVGTAALLLLGTVSVLAFEWGNPAHARAVRHGAQAPAEHVPVGHAADGRVQHLDYSQMREETWLTQMMLMFVGAGPASTGGGIKVTTMVVLFLFIIVGGARRAGHRAVRPARPDRGHPAGVLDHVHRHERRRRSGRS